MAEFQDIAKTTVIVDGKQGINELGKLEMQAKEYSQALKGMRKNTSNWINTTNKLKDTKKRIEEVRKEVGLTGMTMNQLRSKARELRNELNATTTRGTAEYKKLKSELIQVNGLIQRQRMEVRGMAGIWTTMGRSIKQSFSLFGPTALITTGIYATISAIREFKRENIELSDKLADVEKNTELTKNQVDDLLESLMQMDTRSARKELLDLSIIAGKLGIRGVKDIEGFVSAADKINVALGEDLGDVNETMKSLGKLINVFKVDDVLSIEDSLLRVGSAVNDLGRSSVAQEKNIVEFTRRMGGIAPVTKVSIQDILGLGAAGDALGLSMEVMGTAMSQVFTKMSNGRRIYAKFAKDTEGNSMNVNEFTHLLNTDFNSALLAVLRGLQGNEKATTEFVESLGDMGLEGQRVIQVVSALALGVEDIMEQQKISNEAFTEGNSILEEFNLKNVTLGANLSKIWKSISNTFVNSGIVRYFEELTGWMAEMVTIPVSEQLENERQKLRSLHVELSSGNTTRERRLTIINELQEKYPAILGNLDAETISNEELRDKLKEVNEQLINRIVIQMRQEDIDKAITDAAERKNKLLAQEAELKEKIASMAEDYNLDIPEADNLAEQAKKIQQSVSKVYMGPRGIVFSPVAQIGLMIRNYEASLLKYDDLNNFADDLTKERDALIQKLFPEKKEGNNTKNEPLGDLNDSLKSTEELLHSTLDKITKAGYAPVGDAIDANLDMHERFEKQKTAMTEEANRIRIASNKARFEREMEQYDAVIHAFGGVADAFGGMSEFIGDETEKNIRQQLFFQQAAIFASKAASIASAIQGAVAAAAHKGPLAPFVVGGYIASMVGMVLSAFGQIKSVSKQAEDKISKMNEDKSSTRSTSQRSYYHGNLDAPDQYTGMRDKYGPITGYGADGLRHGGEGIIPAYVRQDPAVINAEGIIAAVRAGNSPLQGGARRAGGVSMSLDASTFHEAVKMFIGYFSVLQESGIHAKFYRNDVNKFLKDYNQKSEAEARGNL